MNRFQQQKVLIYAGVCITPFILWSLFSIWTPIFAVWEYWYLRVGVVLYGLFSLALLLSICTIALMVQPSMRHSGWLKRSLQIVMQVAPLLGLLGTVLGVAKGAAQFRIDAGVEKLLEIVGMLVSGLSEALLSTAWGASLSIFALILHLLFIWEEPGVEQKRRDFEIMKNPVITPSPPSL